MQVIALYRRLLCLHKKLPPAFSDIGTQFVREEFKKHKDSRMEHAIKFMQEWTVSIKKISYRLGNRKTRTTFDPQVIFNTHRDNRIT